MKIALCLSGQPRGLPMSFDYIKKNLIEPNNIQDIFLHAWHDEADVGKSYNSTQANQNGFVGSVKPKTKEILLWAYKPKKSIIEPQRSFDHLSNLIGAPTAKQSILASQLYSTFMANSLRQAYEQENNMFYDLVVRTRYDLLYNKPIDLLAYKDEVKSGKIVVMRKFQEDQERFNNADRSMTDIFAFGNSEKMNKFSSVYPEMERLNPLVTDPFSENYHGRFVRVENNIEIAMGDFDFNLMQRLVKL